VWLAKHPPLKGTTDWWGGEVEYLGACNLQTDPDCDHWTDKHDNCPTAFNPLQDDADDDGVGDACDNCVKVANPNQEDTNVVAEELREVDLSCPHMCPRPASPGDPGWHDVFFGDACDEIATTEGSTGLTFEGPDNGGCTCLAGPCNSAPSCCNNSTCRQLLTSTVQFDSWIGNSMGTAPIAAGTTKPVFCACSTTNDLKNCGANFGCTLAIDSAFPTGNSWREIEGFDELNHVDIGTIGHTITTHQERAGNWNPISVTNDWDFVNDLPKFGLSKQPNGNSLPGVLWSHVTSFNLTGNYAAERNGSAPLVMDLNNHYGGMTVAELAPTFVGNPPVCLDCYGLWPDPLRDPDNLLVSSWLFGFTSNVGTEIVAQQGNVLIPKTQSFDSSALALWKDIITGKTEMLVGGEVVTGIHQPAGRLAPAVIVASGTTSVQGAFSATGATISSATPSVTFSGPGSPRAYSAYSRTLYAIDTSNSGATLTTVDVAAALQNQNVRHAIPIAPFTPKKPMVMAWNAQYQRLYLVDVESSDGKNRLRFLTVRPDGVSEELWRTKPTTHLPDKATLTVSATGELVLALLGRPDSGSSEVLLLDGLGRPTLSRDFDDRLAAPALVIPKGVNLPFEREKNDAVPLRNQLRPRSDFSQGICGAKWLRSRADRKFPSPNVLADENCEDADEEGNNEN